MRWRRRAECASLHRVKLQAVGCDDRGRENERADARRTKLADGCARGLQQARKCGVYEPVWHGAQHRFEHGARQLCEDGEQETSE